MKKINSTQPDPVLVFKVYAVLDGAAGEMSRKMTTKVPFPLCKSAPIVWTKTME